MPMNIPPLLIKEVLFKDLFDISKKSLVIPEYQRSYVWDTDKVNDLLRDLQEFFEEENPNQPKDYYLGYILLFDNVETNQYEVIDGQQRLTTLLILQYLIEGSLQNKESIMYNSQNSVNNIIKVRDYIKTRFNEIEQLQNKKFLTKLRFTVVITQIADDAFTFFDTHNNRSVKLGATDFLKAYHLRSIKSEIMQDKVAKIWESKNDTALGLLFDKILWRGRNWKGNNEISFENKDAVLKTFQKQTQKDKTLADCTYPLYPSSKNRGAVSTHWNKDGNVELTSIPINHENAIDFPFALRQPIYDGLNFFHYSQKYVEIHETLFTNDKIENPEIVKMRNFYHKVYTDDMSIYLKQFMQLCLVLYYDMFGEITLLKAAYYFDYLIGESRLSKKQIKQESVKHILKNNSLNILDVISQAYLFSEIFEYIDNLSNIEESYKNIKFEKAEKSVRTRYFERLKDYFKPLNKQLKDRKIWHKIST